MELNNQSVNGQIINKNLNTQQDSFSIKEILFKFIKYWYFFIISLSICFSIAYVLNRLAIPLYSTNSSILVKDRRTSGSSGSESFLEGMNLVNISRNIDNEISVMKSYNISESTIKELDWGVTYFKDRGFSTTEIYGDQEVGFKVKIDSNHLQLLNTKFTLHKIDANSFNLTKEGEPSAFNPKNQSFITTDIKPEFKSGMYKYDEIIEGQFYKFKILKKDFSINNDSKVYFQFNSLSGLVGANAGSLQAYALSKTSSIVILSIQSPTPYKAIEYINKLGEVYVKAGLDEKNKIAENTINFINNYVINISDSLSSSEDKLQKFRTGNKSFDLTSEGKTLFNNVEELKKQKNAFEDDIQYYNYLLKYIENKEDFSKIISPASKSNNPITDKLIGELASFYQQRNEILLSATLKSPQIVILDKKIQSSLNTLEESINNSIKAAKISINIINKRINSFEGSIYVLPKLERSLLGIKRKLDLDEDLYVYLLRKRAEAGIAKAANLPDNKIVEKASGFSKVYPKTEYNYTVSIVIGFMIPIILILIIHYLTTTIKDRKEVEGLTSISVLGVIGHNEKPSSQLISNNPKSFLAESFRSLRSNLQFILRNKDQKIILITSSISGEGKTFCAENLAYILSLGNKKTLLMELDLRKSSRENRFITDNDIGLTHFLIGQATKKDIIKSTQYPNLDIIFSGSLPPNPSEILMDNKISILMAEVKAEYDIIIIDSSPIGLVSDAFELIKYSDLILFVVRQEYTKREHVTKLDEVKQIEPSKKFNIVINDAKYKFTYGYNYGYHNEYFSDDNKKSNLLNRLLNNSKIKKSV